jgi:NADH-quinone oxidoreductase subunit M
LRWYAIIAASGVIFSAVYMLWMFQRVMFGELNNPANQKLKDLDAREITLMVPLLVFVFWIGVYPNTFFVKMEPALQQMIQQVKGRQQVVVAVPGEAAVEMALPPGHPPIAPVEEPATAPATEEPAAAPAAQGGHN